jgi:hypothetical protein
LKTRRIKNQHIIYFAIAIVLGISLAFLLYTTLYLPVPVETQTVYTSFIATENSTVGIDLNGTALTFGRLPQGSSGKRYMVIANYYPYPVKLKTYSSGNISQYLVLSDYNFTLQPGEEKNLTIAANAPLHAPGIYDGYIRFVFFKS